LAAERRRREAGRGQIGGHSITAGRWVADALLPWDIETPQAMILSGMVDTAVQVFDPTALLAGKLGAIQETRRVFAAADDTAGAVHGLRSVLRPQAVGQWLDSPTAQARFQWWAGESSAYRIWLASKRKLPIRVARDLADTHTPEQARAVLEPLLGRRIAKVAAVESTSGRKLNVMPARGRIDAHDPDIVAWEVEASLRSVNAPDEVIAEAVDRVARADNAIELNAAIRRAVDDDIDGILARAGVSEQHRSQILALHEDVTEEASRTFVESITHQGVTDSPVMLAYYPGAHLFVEHAPRYLRMPDGRVTKSLTSQYANIFGRNVFRHADGTYRLPTALADGFVNAAWKPLQLMRLAWTVRVIGEEQLRMAAAGYD
ncbi:MAG: hypothetical protein GWO04_44985, partial [Actinobacteria bacterium]|nr:hypothetical protein [Actinomycetota bacterium]NIS36657.1 hypothetical protein [Actinomycetota bacterium]